MWLSASLPYSGMGGGHCTPHSQLTLPSCRTLHFHGPLVPVGWRLVGYDPCGVLSPWAVVPIHCGLHGLWSCGLSSVELCCGPSVARPFSHCSFGFEFICVSTLALARLTCLPPAAGHVWYILRCHSLCLHPRGSDQLIPGLQAHPLESELRLGKAS